MKRKVAKSKNAKVTVKDLKPKKDARGGIIKKPGSKLFDVF